MCTALCPPHSQCEAERAFVQRAHKEVLYFASSFFQAALCGGWAETENETGRPQSISSVITISQPPVVPGSKPGRESPSEITFAPIDPDMDPDEFNLDVDVGSGSEDSDEPEASSEDKAKAREDSLNKLEKSSPSTPTTPSGKGKAKAPDVDGKSSAPHTPTTGGFTKVHAKGKEKEKRPDAIIVLKEEKVSCHVRVQYKR